MLEASACLYIFCPSKSVSDRLCYYFDPKTRPDFPEDVPDEEAELVDYFEEMPDPEVIKKPTDRELIVYFDEDALEVRELLPNILQHFSMKQALFYEESIEHQAYYRFEEDSFEFFYSPVPLEFPDDEERYNRNLSGSMQAELKQARRKGIDKALLYLGRKLNEEK
jgi:hypothetical protein